MKNFLSSATEFLVGLTGFGVAGIVFGVAANVAFGGGVPFVGDTLDAALGLVERLGDAGLLGLLVAGWLASKLD